MRRIGRGLVLVLAALGVAFVIRSLVRDWDQVVSALEGAQPLMLVLALVFALASLTRISLLWRRILGEMNVDLDVFPALHSYFVGQLGKYVPGGIWPVVGRSEMARTKGVDPVAAYGSTLLSMSITYLASAIAAMVFVLLSARSGDILPWWLLLAGVILGVVALHPKVLGLALALARRFTGRRIGLVVPEWKRSAWLLLLHLPVWVGIGTATWLVAIALDPASPEFANLLFAAALSWLIGFVAIGAPGGIGVREAVFVATAVSVSSVGVAAAIAVVARIVFVLADLVGAGLTSLWSTRGAGGSDARGGP